MNPALPTAAEIEAAYPDLGSVLKITPLTGGVVSSLLARVETVKGHWIWKQPLYRRRPDQTAEEMVEDWRVIGQVRDLLFHTGVPVEQPVSHHRGDWLGLRDGQPVWLTPDYGQEGFDGSVERLRAAAAALGRFHNAGAALLQRDPGLAARVRGRLKRHLPLHESLKRLPSLRSAFLDPEAETRYPEMQTYPAVFREVKEALKSDLPEWIHQSDSSLKAGGMGPRVLGHHDFHPANVLYPPEGGIRILDLEQMGEGPAGKCIALSVTRFVLEAVPDRNPEQMSALTRQWMDAYLESATGITEEDLYALPDWIRALELEKTLRILGRFLDGECFPAMIRKLQTHHLWLYRHAGFFEIG